VCKYSVCLRICKDFL